MYTLTRWCKEFFLYPLWMQSAWEALARDMDEFVIVREELRVIEKQMQKSPPCNLLTFLFSIFNAWTPERLDKTIALFRRVEDPQAEQVVENLLALQQHIRDIHGAKAAEVAMHLDSLRFVQAHLEPLLYLITGTDSLMPEEYRKFGRGQALAA